MASSDDEADAGPQSVSDYHFEDDEQEPVSFSLLPVQWSEGSKSPGNESESVKGIFLRGAADGGLQTVFKPVKAWKFDLSNAIPVISVLTNDNSWIKLLKPRKSFEGIIRTTLITVQLLHFVKRSPDSSAKSIWDYLSKTFSSYEARPSQDDLIDHMDLISEVAGSDDSLKKCKFLLSFLEEKPSKKSMTDKDKQTPNLSGFLVDDTEEGICEVEGEEDESNDDDLFDTVCAFCDNGGELVCCDGKCMRSFHATVEAGEESLCRSLGFTKKKVDEIQNFICKNCEYEQHQCFACGNLGCSKKSSDAEVFQCANATCGYFYHPHCVAKLLHPGDKVTAEELQKKIVAREAFLCPIHKCFHCKQGENKQILDLQFAVCRRCPTSFHQKCLPREIRIAKDDDEANEREGQEEEEEEGVVDRGWRNLLPNRILLYCLKHKIEEDLGTPSRNHIKFPGSEIKRITVEEKTSKVKHLSEKGTVLADVSSGKTASKGSTLLSSASKQQEIIEKGKQKLSSTHSFKKTGDSSVRSLKERKKVLSPKVDGSGSNKPSLGDKLFDYMNKNSDERHTKQVRNDSGLNKTGTDMDAKKNLTDLPKLDADSERRFLALMKTAASSVTLEDIVKQYKPPSTHCYSSRAPVDKTITLGKVEGAVEAIRTAAKKLADDCSIEDAKAVCEPGVVSQVFKWKNKLRVYLAPFLHGMRYTSFGRHFTKPDKLAEVVNILHWYVESGDMIVDFCCGANDFSCLMKKKLDETGKTCSYKNYDLFPAKNDFNFEQRDWMTVQPQELRKEGSKLIMGLNPPFGVNAALANQFIDKALKFKPKLLILIVPPETQRLDKKNPPYDLIWEDYESFGGKSFYLPGSVNETDKPLDQWNNVAPVLYLWSRRDFTKTHKAIAENHGHVPGQHKRTDMRDTNGSEVQCPSSNASVLSGNQGSHDNKELQGLDDRLTGVQSHREESPSTECRERKSQGDLGLDWKKQSEIKKSNKRKNVEEENLEKRGASENSAGDSRKIGKFARRSPPVYQSRGHGTEKRYAGGDTLTHKETRYQELPSYDEQMHERRGASGNFRGDSQQGAELARRSPRMPSPSQMRESDYQYGGHERAGPPYTHHHAAPAAAAAYGDGNHDANMWHGIDTGGYEGLSYRQHRPETRYDQPTGNYFESSAPQPSYLRDTYEPQSSSYVSSRSVMDRYAPQLNELNQQPMAGGFGYDPPVMMNGGGGGYDARGHPGTGAFQGDSMHLPPHGPLHPGPAYGAEQVSGFPILGFAPGPQPHPFGDPYNSAGWMND
ncbi:unnamed protein product [Linum trigynum]|uniref:Zinc finger PHD-type domain-containing protein n=1 Tax=Linum trigynum TaxID=586398 RepID=A0AAV2FWU5_9ROSI